MMWAVYLILCHVFVMCLAMSLNELEEFSNFIKETSQLDLNLKSNIPQEEFDDEEPISDHAWEVSGKFEGDLILNERQRRVIVENVAEGLARNGVTDSTKRWPNNEVIFFIQAEHFNSDQLQAIQDGIDDLARVSCVKFRPYVKGDRDAVVIQGSRRGCFSQVGYQGGYQVLNLSRRHPAGRGCFRHGTVVHEMLHTLGFYHMQSSPDRDDYIDVIWENIIKPARHNFRKYNSLSVSDFGVGYDYDSVLHYSRRAFSTNGQDTIVPKKLGATIGQRIGLSEKDVQKLNKMYCDADSGLLLDDSITKKSEKKKSVKNKPFTGHGLGYQQGKTVIIKLPGVGTSQPLLQLPVFNHFSKTSQELPSTLIQGVGVRKEMNTNTYGSPSSSDNEVNMKSLITSISQEHFDRDGLKTIEPYKEQNAKAERGESSGAQEDLAEAFYRLSEMSKSEKQLPQLINDDDFGVTILHPINTHNQELEKDTTSLHSPFAKSSFKDESKDSSDYHVDNPLSNYYAVAKQEPVQYYSNFVNNKRPSEHGTSQEYNAIPAYSFGPSNPIKLQETEQNLPIHVWQPQNNDFRDTFSSSRYSALPNMEQVNYSDYRQQTPSISKWYTNDELKQISDYNPRRLERLR